MTKKDLNFPSGSAVKSSSATQEVRERQFSTWFGRSSGGGHGDPVNRGAWQGAVHRVTETQT